MKKEKKIVIKNPILRTLRNNLRIIIIRAVQNREFELMDLRHTLDYGEERDNIDKEMEKIRNALNSSICLCYNCSSKENDMVYIPFFEEWYCTDCYKTIKWREDRFIWRNQMIAALYEARCPLMFMELFIILLIPEDTAKNLIKDIIDKYNNYYTPFTIHEEYSAIHEMPVFKLSIKPEYMKKAKKFDEEGFIQDSDLKYVDQKEKERKNKMDKAAISFLNRHGVIDENQIIAALFVARRPLTIEELSAKLEVSEEKVQEILDNQTLVYFNNRYNPLIIERTKQGEYLMKLLPEYAEKAAEFVLREYLVNGMKQSINTNRNIRNESEFNEADIKIMGIHEKVIGIIKKNKDKPDKEKLKVDESLTLISLIPKLGEFYNENKEVLTKIGYTPEILAEYLKDNMRDFLNARGVPSDSMSIAEFIKIWESRHN